MTLWSTIRVRTYKAALQRETPPTLAILRIPRLELEVPVYDGTTDAVLDLAAGRIEDTALPGTPGNVGIAAHRDGFFRVLKDIKEGDALVLDTPVATEQYRVEWIKITTPDDVSVIEPTPGPAVTLVGCYPFYHRAGAAAVHRPRGARGGIARGHSGRQHAPNLRPQVERGQDGRARLPVRESSHPRADRADSPLQPGVHLLQRVRQILASSGAGDHARAHRPPGAAAARRTSRSAAASRCCTRNSTSSSGTSAEPARWLD